MHNPLCTPNRLPSFLKFMHTFKHGKKNPEKVNRKKTDSKWYLESILDPGEPKSEEAVLTIFCKAQPPNVGCHKRCKLCLVSFGDTI